MADNTSITTASEDLAPVKQSSSRKARLKRHCVRFWWIYVFTFIAVVLCVVLPIVYVAYPRQAQSDVNNSVIIAESEGVTNAKPNSFFYNNSAVLEVFTSNQPQLYSWNGSYYLENSSVPFLSVTIPGIRAANGAQIQIAQEVQIYNMEEFIQNNNMLFKSRNFSIYLRGSGGLRLGGLPYINVNYDKKIDLAGRCRLWQTSHLLTTTGLNGFEGLSVSDFRLLNTTLSDGANAVGNVTLSNPSIFTLAMGDVALDISVNGTSIGNATLPDFILTPGTHQYTLHVTSNQTAVLGLLQQPAYRCGILPLSIQGQRSVVDGQDIPYFSRPLQENPLSTTLDLVPALEDAGLGGLINKTLCQS